MALLLKHQSAAEFISRFRGAFRDGERERVVRLGKWLLARIAAGDITDAQCRSAFGKTTTQWNVLKTKMQTRINAWNEIQSAVGE